MTAETTTPSPSPDTPSDTRPAWMGINHLALITTDMDATTRVSGTRCSAPRSSPPWPPRLQALLLPGHRRGPDHRVLPVPEREVETYAKPAGIPYEHASQFDHLSLGLPDEQALEDLRARLSSTAAR
jgi:hypothetical protein